MEGVADPMVESLEDARPVLRRDDPLQKVVRLCEVYGCARLGVMGGTFDPVHLGHLACAEMARDACGLDEVQFMVAPRPWMKGGRDIADVKARIDMCRLAVEGNPSFSVSTLEACREGKTYTSDTLRELRAMLPDEVKLFFIIGADTLTTLPGWHEREQLAQLATFVCVARPGREDSAELLAAARAKEFDVEWVDAPLLDISSSEVRRRVREGDTVRYLVPDAVRGYIERHGVYGGGERG